ncbi:MAG: BolA family transcriptional regulator [Anaerolineales bacterium]|nr:BolA family transcriptional regulator [Anaerolineales bacterium]
MVAEEIKETILAAVPDAEVYIYDPDGQHFQALVISPAFEKMPLVRQHQMVMKAMTEAFETSVHALGLKTFTPAKWQNEKQNYGF